MSRSRSVLVPLPSHDVDPTELAVPWRALRAAGHDVVLATPTGGPAAADPVMLTGLGLGPLGRFLRADDRGRAAYAELASSGVLDRPTSYEAIDTARFDALFLPGGHAQGMREYLESITLQRMTAAMFADGKAVGAICHGVLVCARASDARTGRSALHGRTTTALPSRMERTAIAVTRPWAGDYYRTYPETVEEEVTARLARPSDFQAGPGLLSPRSALRDAPGREGRGFVVQDGRYVSARWPGDAHAFAAAFLRILEQPS